MPKQNPLARGLERHAPARVPAPIPAPVKERGHKTAPPPAPSRQGRVVIAGHYAPEVQTALKVTAAEERTTVQALLAEGINMVFAKRGKPEIAKITAD